MDGICIKNGFCYIDGKFQKADILVAHGKIERILKQEENTILPVYDAKGNYIVPGFIDIHTHGAVGVDVNGADVDGLKKLSHFFAMQGTTSWLASVLTDTKEQTLWCINQYNKMKEEPQKGAELLGIHLEGPFLASEYKGAMPEHLLREADLKLLDEYQEASEGGIRYITVSPEVDGIPEAIIKIKAMGIVTAIGHSGADYETALKCIENGAMSATHTFNAMKLLHQHFPAIAGAVLESDVYCEAICDGRHLHPGIVRLLLKTKGMNRVVAITDSIMAAGLPDGDYKLGVNDVVVKDGDAKLKENGVRAGSTLTTAKALKNLIEFTGKPLEDVLPLLTVNPAKLIGVEDRKGSVAIGKDGDLVILDKEYNVLDTFLKGDLVLK